MSSRLHPESIDARAVLRVYAWVAISFGLAAYGWPTLTGLPSGGPVPGVPYGWYAVPRLAGALCATLGFCAIGLEQAPDAESRRRALRWFAIAHLVFGVLFLLQWQAILSLVLPPLVGWLPVVVGLVMLQHAGTERLMHTVVPSRRRLISTFLPPWIAPESSLAPATRDLRSAYEEQIRQHAQREERARLARDLHDAVKQQLFAVQTSAATAQERLAGDPHGARNALEGVRSAARDAMDEMEVLLESLEASPLDVVGLVQALDAQCKALGFRTGAIVTFAHGDAPSNEDLPPGTTEALYRIAQEALSNVARHARATLVSVRLSRTADAVRLTIHDDGAGFIDGSVTQGLGTRSIRERASALGGEVTRESAPGAGTTVSVSLPLWPKGRGYRPALVVWTVVAALATLQFLGAARRDSGWAPLLLLCALVCIATASRYAAAVTRTRRTETSAR